MSYDPVTSSAMARILQSLVKKDPMAQAQPKYLPSFAANPTQFINPAYTQVDMMDGSLTPMQQFQAFKQTGMRPQDQSTFTPWNQPATPMVEVFTPPAQAKPGFSGTSGAK